MNHQTVPSLMGAAAALSASLFIVSPVSACGVSGPDGVSACSLAEHNEAMQPRWHLGVSGVYTSTALRFDGNTRGDQTRGAIVLSLAHRLSNRWTLEGELGGAFGGKLRMPNGEHEFSPGPTAAIGASWRVVDAAPFVVLTSLLSFSAATTRLVGTTEDVHYEAFDLRAGVLVGTTLFERLSPYALGRAFGGPVFWRYQGASVTGTDTHHYQLGAGLAVLLSRHTEAFVEGVPLGEKALSAGLSVAF